MPYDAWVELCLDDDRRAFSHKSKTENRKSKIGRPPHSMFGFPFSVFRSLEIAPGRLFRFDRFEERLEVALAESAAAVALDDLEEERRPVLDGAGEDLEEVALVVAVDQDAQLLDLVHRLADLADALGQVLVVVLRHAEELHAVGAQLGQR